MTLPLISLALLLSALCFTSLHAEEVADTREDGKFQPLKFMGRVDQFQHKLVKWGPGGAARVLGGHCGYSRPQLKELLKKKHGWRRGEDRFVYLMNWISGKDLVRAMADRAKHQVSNGEPVNATVCVLAAIQGPPCFNRRCIIPIYLRPQFADAVVMYSMLECLGFAYLKGYNFSTILDAGANIGMASVVFGLMFPRATVISVELDPQNFLVLSNNTRYLSNVIVLNAGVYNAVGATAATSAGKGWNHRLKSVDLSRGAASANGVPIGTVTVEFLLRLFGLRRFELVKMDVEGSELEVFTKTEEYDPVAWLDGVKVLAVETHERFRRGSQRAVEGVLQERPGMVRTNISEHEIWYDSAAAADPRTSWWAAKSGCNDSQELISLSAHTLW